MPEQLFDPLLVLLLDAGLTLDVVDQQVGGVRNYRLVLVRQDHVGTSGHLVGRLFRLLVALTRRRDVSARSHTHTHVRTSLWCLCFQMAVKWLNRWVTTNNK